MFLRIVGRVFQQVGAQPAGAFHGLFHFPVLDFRLVAAEQYLGNLPPFVVGRACVDGGGEHVVLERDRSLGTC